jgi:hypothetical protein
VRLRDERTRVAVPAAVTWDAPSRTVRVRPDERMPPSTRLVLELSGAAMRSRRSAEEMAGYSLSFTTDGGEVHVTVRDEVTDVEVATTVAAVEAGAGADADGAAFRRQAVAWLRELEYGEAAMDAAAEAALVGGFQFFVQLRGARAGSHGEAGAGAGAGDDGGAEAAIFVELMTVSDLAALRDGDVVVVRPKS